MIQNGEEFKRRYRSYFNPFLSNQMVNKFQNSVIYNLIRDIYIPMFTDLANSGEIFEAQKIFYPYTARSLISVGYGLIYSQEECEEISYLVDNIQRHFEELLRGKVKSQEEIEAINKKSTRFDELSANLIKRCKDNEESQGSFIDLFRNQEDPELISHEVKVLLIGGIHTATSVLSFAAYHLSKYPEIQESLFQDIIISSDPSSPYVSYDEIKSNKQFRNFINENMRYASVANAIDRISFEHDIELEPGVVIPKNTAILVLLDC